MKIIRASVRGFMGISELDVQLGHVNVFAGPNGAGKSSVIEAILLPIFGETPRTSRKKDWCYMIRSQHRNAEIFVQVEETETSQPMVADLEARINPKSNSVRAMKKPDLLDRILLNPLEFFSLPPKAKADLAGDVRLEVEQVRVALLEHGMPNGPISQQVTDIIVEQRIVGAEKVLVDRRLQATRAVPDPGPEPQFVLNAQFQPSPTSESIEQGRKNAQQWNHAYDQRKMAHINAQHQSIEVERRAASRRDAEKVLADVNVPDEFPRQAELDSTESRTAELKGQQDQALMSLNALECHPCPECGQPYSPEAVEWNKRIADLATTLQAEQGPLFELRNEHSEWLARHREQARAKTALENFDKLPPLPEVVDLEATLTAMEDAKAQNEACSSWVLGAQAYVSAKHHWDERCRQHEIRSSERSHWDKAVHIIRDPSFKTKLVADPLQKAKDRLAATMSSFGMDVHLEDTMDVLVDARPWWLLSASQKLRASILLADAFAHASGSRILKVDGVDMLVGQALTQMLYFIQQVKGDYDTVLLALATPTTAVPPFMSEAQWNLRWFGLERGVVVNQGDI